MRLIQTLDTLIHIQCRAEDTVTSWVDSNKVLLLRPPSRMNHFYLKFAFTSEEIDCLSGYIKEDVYAYAESLFVRSAQSIITDLNLEQSLWHISFFSITRRLKKDGAYGIEAKLGVKGGSV